MKKPNEYLYNPLWYLLMVKLPAGLIIGGLLWLVWYYFHNFFPIFLGLIIGNTVGDLKLDLKKLEEKNSGGSSAT